MAAAMAGASGMSPRSPPPSIDSCTAIAAIGVVGVSEDADRDDADCEGDVEASVAFVHVERADDDDGDGGAEDCTVDDRRENPGQVFGDQRLPCKVALYGEGKYECAGGDAERNNDRECQCGEQCA